MEFCPYYTFSWQPALWKLWQLKFSHNQLEWQLQSSPAWKVTSINLISDVTVLIVWSVDHPWWLLLVWCFEIAGTCCHADLSDCSTLLGFPLIIWNSTHLHTLTLILMSLLLHRSKTIDHLDCLAFWWSSDHHSSASIFCSCGCWSLSCPQPRLLCDWVYLDGGLWLNMQWWS